MAAQSERNELVRVSREIRKLYGPKKPFLRIRTTRAAELLFYHAFK